jgi:hypothetical protein
MKAPRALPPPVKTAAYICAPPRRRSLLFLLACSSTHSRERPMALLWCGVRRGCSSSWRLPQRSVPPDLLRRGASPSAVLGLQEAVVFFLSSSSVRAVWTGSTSSSSRSTSTSSPRLLLRFVLLVCSDDHCWVKSILEPRIS